MKDHYHPVTKCLHWGIVISIMGMLILGFSFNWITNRSLQVTFIQWHKAFGLCVLVFIMLRIIWHVVSEHPAQPVSVSKIEASCARGVQWSLMIMTLLLPLSGWIMSTASGRTTSIFGLFSLKAPGVSKDAHVSWWMWVVHHWGAWLIIGLMALHIVAAFWHHCVNKNNILSRMLPSR